VIVGQHTHICVRHSAYGALIRGYRVTVPRDGVCCCHGVEAEAALEYLVMP
jgi:nicotinamidase-related amidase